ncbi:hypothetical protein CAEBREN_02746 [Caenorhabditis brenneri]|uniref:Uncharacterized protein n=1 Tax=Caenorhabditis brenneri TaxID=135651 RepID=G0MD14_CAEBE|nr:hypothetical protein CAEBREN_02746 [Caenorhabditis brenneri]
MGPTLLLTPPSNSQLVNLDVMVRVTIMSNPGESLLYGPSFLFTLGGDEDVMSKGRKPVKYRILAWTCTQKEPKIQLCPIYSGEEKTGTQYHPHADV